MPSVSLPSSAALANFTLRNGELADILIDRLNQQGIYVIVKSGHDVLPVATRRARDPAETD